MNGVNFGHFGRIAVLSGPLVTGCYTLLLPIATKLAPYRGIIEARMAALSAAVGRAAAR